MKVEIVREAKLSKIDHLFVVLAEGVKAEGTGVSELVDGAVKDAGFEGRSDESITILSGTPRKLTLVGIGKKVTVRAVRTAIYAIGKIGRKQSARRTSDSVRLRIPYFPNSIAARLSAD